MRRRPPPRAVAGIGLVAAASAARAWRDLNRRPESRVRGSKRMWRVLLALNPGNSLLYWLFGRR